MAYIGYTHNHKQLSYWHTYTGKEIDAVIGEAEIGIEIKSTGETSRLIDVYSEDKSLVEGLK